MQRNLTIAATTQPEPEIIFHARAARDIAARFGNAAFGKHQLTPNVIAVLLAGDIIEPCQQYRGLRLTFLGRTLAASSRYARDIEAETRADYLARLLGSAQRFYL